MIHDVFPGNSFPVLRHIIRGITIKFYSHDQEFVFVHSKMMFWNMEDMGY